MTTLSFDAVHRTYQSNVVALNARPDVTPAEFETLAENFGKQRIAFRDRVFELHSEMIDATTADEWKGLYRYPTDPARTIAPSAERSVKSSNHARSEKQRLQPRGREFGQPRTSAWL